MIRLSRPAAWVALGAFGLFASAFTLAPPAVFHGLVRLFGVEPYRFLFVDTDTVLSALRCRRAGIDVFATNPCDDLGRVFDYSPLWLVGAVFPVTSAWITPVGLAVDLGFLAALFLLPVRDHGRDWIWMAAASVSFATVFALERGNNDCVIFLLVALACSFLARNPPRRLLAYGLVSLAGLLKYYPMIVLGLLVSERRSELVRVLMLVAGLSIGFLVLFGAELSRALTLVPIGSFFGDMFGASTLSGGLASLTGQTRPVAVGGELLLLIAAMTAALRLQAGAKFRSDISGTDPARRIFMTAGALLTLGCFLTAQNIGYRAINLLLVLPGVLELQSSKWNEGYFKRLSGVIVLLLWSGGWRMWAGLVSPGLFLWAWLLREAMWWYVAIFLFAVVFLHLSEAPEFASLISKAEKAFPILFFQKPVP